MRSLALVRDILRPAPCEQELQEDALPRPLVTKLPAPVCITWTSALAAQAISVAQTLEHQQTYLSQATPLFSLHAFHRSRWVTDSLK